MDKDELRKKMSNEILNIQLLPSITETSLKEVEYVKYPIENLSALGIATKPLVAAMQSLGGREGTSGIYMVNTKGHEMFQSKDGFIGSLKTEEGAVGGGQAIMTKLACDPTLIFMSMTLMTVERKLDEINNIQREMLDFVKAKEKANLRGNMNTLIDILNNYKFNFDNEKYKTNKHILVQDIRRNSEQSILLNRDLIQSMLAKKELIHSAQEINAKIKKADEIFKEYQTALYLNSFASFLEVILLENFDKEYISSVKNKIDEYSIKYRELYTKCYNEMEGYAEKSVQTIFTKGLAEVSKSTGKAVAKIPVINKAPVDELLILSSEKIKNYNDKRNNKSIHRLTVSSMKGANPFVDSLIQISKIYNEQVEVLIDSKNLYLIEENNLLN